MLFFSRPPSQSWPRHGRTFSIYLCPFKFWLTLPRGVLSTYRCCPSRPCAAFIACVHLTLFLALSLFQVTSLFLRLVPCFDCVKSSRFTSALLRTHLWVFFAVHETCRMFSSPFSSKASLSLKSVCCDFSIFSPVMPGLTWYGIPSYTHHLL